MMIRKLLFSSGWATALACQVCRPPSLGKQVHDCMVRSAVAGRKYDGLFECCCLIWRVHWSSLKKMALGSVAAGRGYLKRAIMSVLPLRCSNCQWAKRRYTYSTLLTIISILLHRGQVSDLDRLVSLTPMALRRGSCSRTQPTSSCNIDTQCLKIIAKPEFEL
jgi:hypothetical protein